MSVEKDMAVENIAIARMIAREVMADIGKPADMAYAFLWGYVKGYKKKYKVLFCASASYGNWGEVMSKIESECAYVSGLYINYD